MISISVVMGLIGFFAGLMREMRGRGATSTGGFPYDSPPNQQAHHAYGRDADGCRLRNLGNPKPLVAAAYIGRAVVGQGVGRRLGRRAAPRPSSQPAIRTLIYRLVPILDIAALVVGAVGTGGRRKRAHRSQVV